MNDLSIVHMLDAKANLREPVKDLRLGEVVWFAGFLELFLPLIDLGGQLTVITVFHHDVQCTVPRQVDFLKADDVRMRQSFENFGLHFCGFFLTGVHLADVDHLHNVQLA